MATAIEFNHVGKQYRLGLVSTRTLSHDFNRWWQTAVLKKEDPYLKIGETNDRSVAGNSEYVWALRDIDFKVEQGDVVGIIGKNGAGKSTLLKLLSKVTGPTVGSIRARGRIGALLEVGTGFHPEMTGRENIFMNGAIMGMSKAEVSRKLDEIIDFSGCERYIDTPVKRYSSGMTVRLGFAVAAHLDPEILVVDEVLAVGDAEFQKKAIGKMQEVSSGGGRTVLFVSHNMASIKNLCKNGILLENGGIRYVGSIEDVVNEYLIHRNHVHQDNLMARFNNRPLPESYIERVCFRGANGNEIDSAMAGEPLDIEVYFHKGSREDARINVGIYDALGDKRLHLSTEYVCPELVFKNRLQGSVLFHFDKCPLPGGSYTLNFTFWVHGKREDWIQNMVSLDVSDGDFYRCGKIPSSKENHILLDYECVVR
jgi:lipopolysaccharide transport system ATP-binding protein